MKVGYLDRRMVNVKPEFADCAKAAKEHKAALKQVTEAAKQAFAELEGY